jgi:hypothetical protein
MARHLNALPAYAGAVRTKRTPDLLIPGAWALEFKLARPFGDNGKEAENWSVNLGAGCPRRLVPSRASAVAGCRMEGAVSHRPTSAFSRLASPAADPQSWAADSDVVISPSWEVSLAQPPLRLLHSDTILNRVKLDQFRRLSTVALIESLEPGRPGALKARPDGTVLDGHHRIVVLRERGVSVDTLPREVAPHEMGE